MFLTKKSFSCLVKLEDLAVWLESDDSVFANFSNHVVETDKKVIPNIFVQLRISLLC